MGINKSFVVGANFSSSKSFALRTSEKSRAAVCFLALLPRLSGEMRCTERCPEDFIFISVFFSSPMHSWHDANDNVHTLHCTARCALPSRRGAPLRLHNGAARLKSDRGRREHKRPSFALMTWSFSQMCCVRARHVCECEDQSRAGRSWDDLPFSS